MTPNGTLILKLNNKTNIPLEFYMPYNKLDVRVNNKKVPFTIVEKNVTNEIILSLSNEKD